MPNVPHAHRLRRKVVLIVVAIVLLPMLITGVLSATWVSQRIEASIEAWIREAAAMEDAALLRLHENARVLANLLVQPGAERLALRPGQSPIPPRLRPLAAQLGIDLVQLYDPRGALIYSDPPLRLATSWAPGQDEAVVKVRQGSGDRLAAITILRIPEGAPDHDRLVLGTLFDKQLLTRLGQMSGLKTRLFYPRGGDFDKAFSTDDRALRLRLPPGAFDELAAHRPFYSPVAEDGAYRALYTPLVDTSGNLEAVLFNGLPRTTLTGGLSDRALLTGVIVLFGALLAIGTGLLLGRLVVRPVTYLHRAVMALAANPEQARVPIAGDDELGDLARAFNGLAGSLVAARDAQRHAFQRDKLAAMGELSLAMAHEIRNPIGAITTASGLLERNADPERQQRLRAVISEEGRRLDRLLKDFQQLARHGLPTFTRIAPEDPLEHALTLLLAGRDDITVTRRYTHGGRRIEADAELLRQAWMNLVRNALEAIAGGPCPNAGRLLVGSEVLEHGLRVYLEDSGPGVPIEEMTRLFEPFHTTKEHGSGLGLTIAHSLADANGAQLELVAGDGPGARFAITFPHPAPPPTEETPCAAAC